MDKDFHLFPLAQRAGIGEIRIDNVTVFSAPRNAERLRKEDLLACMISVQEGTPLTSEEIQKYLQKVFVTFYATNGSVTRALQAAAEIINQDLMETNLHDPGGQGPTEAALNLAVWHKGSIFHAHCGSAVSVCIQENDVDIKRDTAVTSKNLGVKRAIDIQFYQTDFAQGGVLILCSQLPESWTRPMLQNSHRLNAEQLKRRLANRTDIDITAGVIFVTDGSGKASVKTWPLRAERPSLELPTQPRQIPEREESEPVHTPLFGPEQVNTNTSGAENKHDFNLSEDKVDETPAIVLPAKTEDIVTVPIDETNDYDTELNGRGKGQPAAFLRLLAKVWVTLNTLNTRWKRFLARIHAKLPFGLAGKTTMFSPAFMRVLVVIVPVVLALVFSAIYITSGQTGKYEELMLAAQNYASQAENEKDAMLRRELWRNALENAQKAGTFVSTNESTQLVNLVESKLDELDLVSRLEFRPALTTMLPSDIRITRMLSATSGIYALDSASGTLLRLFLNSKGFYELDKEFVCRIDAGEVGKTGKILDFAILPANDSNYRVLALDTTGNLLYCQPGSAPVSRTLIPPEGGWKRIIGFAYDRDILYVLDADTDRVWRYKGENPKNPNQPGIAFLQAPVSFFDTEIPDLGGAIDLGVNQGDLYVLHDDGHMTTCHYGEDKSYQLTDCIDPTPYNDSRLGREKNPWIFMDSQFGMMQDLRMPTPAIYILDIKNNAVLRFSYILSLEKVFKAKTNRNYPLPEGAPTSMMATSDQELFLAYDNQLFFAPLR